MNKDIFGLKGKESGKGLFEYASVIALGGVIFAIIFGFIQSNQHAENYGLAEDMLKEEFQQENIIMDGLYLTHDKKHLRSNVYVNNREYIVLFEHSSKMFITKIGEIKTIVEKTYGNSKTKEEDELDEILNSN